MLKMPALCNVYQGKLLACDSTYILTDFPIQMDFIFQALVRTSRTTLNRTVSQQPYGILLIFFSFLNFLWGNKDSLYISVWCGTMYFKVFNYVSNFAITLPQPPDS